MNAQSTTLGGAQSTTVGGSWSATECARCPYCDSKEQIHGCTGPSLLTRCGEGPATQLPILGIVRELRDFLTDRRDYLEHMVRVVTQLEMSLLYHTKEGGFR